MREQALLARAVSTTRCAQKRVELARTARVRFNATFLIFFAFFKLALPIVVACASRAGWMEKRAVFLSVYLFERLHAQKHGFSCVRPRLMFQNCKSFFLLFFNHPVKGESFGVDKRGLKRTRCSSCSLTTRT